LPVALALCTWWLRRRFTARDLFPLVPFFALSALAAGWTIWEQKYHSGAEGAAWAQTFPERVAIAGRVGWFYLGNLAWPSALIFNTSRASGRSRWQGQPSRAAPEGSPARRARVCCSRSG